ncbi:hypothetical protein C6P42_001896 [Pichia californica]|nr:hypothetical protein C6P42_001896 [[Candida] californica]
MKNILKVITLLLSIANRCLADDAVYIPTTMSFNKGSAEIWSCYTGVEDFVYDYTPLMLGLYSSTYDVLCGYPPATGSILLCSVNISAIQTEKYFKKIFKATANYCARYSSFSYDSDFYEAQYENATKHFVEYYNVENFSQPLYSPVMPNVSALLKEYKGYRSYYFNIDAGTWFSVGICGYFSVLILISAIYNFTREAGLTRFINNSKISKLCQKYIIFPTLFPNGKFTQYYGWKYFSLLFPNRAQFLVDLGLFIMQVAFYSRSYGAKGTHWFGDETYAWQRFLSDRTGIMAFGKIPLLILFAGRNNFLLYITGWSFSTFLHFHKVVAYWMFLDSMIHSVAYTIECLGYYVYYLQNDRYFACGVAATVLCGFLLLQAMHPLRSWYYEYFLTIHVVIALCFIIMCWYHCRELGWLEWLIAACSVWFFDRLLRAIRMAAFGYKDATITAVDNELMKVEVAKPSWWFHKPGTYCYVYFSGWLFWENHPFTTVVEGDKICAYIKVKRGVTARVWKQLIKNNNTITRRICIEGPYGGDGFPKLKKCNETILIAGGSGAPGILESAGQVNTGKMVWVAPNLQTVKAYQKLIENVKIPLEIFITKEQSEKKILSLQELFVSFNIESSGKDTDSSGKESDSDKNIDLSSPGLITVNYCRPNLYEIIDSSIRDSNSNNIGIMSCAPPAMSDEIRNIIANNATSWEKSIDYFDEFQIW